LIHYFVLLREKMGLEKEKAQKEADIRIRNGEVAALQKELDAINSTVTQLQMQKGEAQKRLDELDDKVGLHFAACMII
jgi:epidermal growth factor receptor substrate 15